MYLEKLKLDSRVAVVTGGGRAIGLACRTALAQAGASVVCADVGPAPQRDRVVERNHEVARRGGLQALLDGFPRRQQVGERDRAEIVAERGAGACRRRLHGGDAGRADDLDALRAGESIGA